MPFRLADPPARGQIRQYLDSIEDQGQSFAASVELGAELAKIVADPLIGSPGPTGPFESRRFHAFRLEGGNERRLAHVAYRVAADGWVEILAFSSLPA